ncbi:MAG: M66 family metalloprotease [Myxococcota bacterium]
MQRVMWIFSMLLLLLAACSDDAAVMPPDSSEGPTNDAVQATQTSDIGSVVDTTAGEDAAVTTDDADVMEPAPEDVVEPPPEDVVEPPPEDVVEPGPEDIVAPEDVVEPEDTPQPPAADAAADTDASDTSQDPLAGCSDDLIAPLAWFSTEAPEDLMGSLEFGQTHVTAADETRLAPRVTSERETLLLFTPEGTLDPSVDFRIAALAQGELLGVIRMNPPSALPESLEQGLTLTPLDPYSTAAWSATLPWPWMAEGVTLRLGVMTGGVLRTLDHTLLGLGSPHRFTLTRTHMVLFGEPDFPIIPPQPATKVALDMAPWVPGAELRWVDTSPWRLDKLVVNTAEGPRWAHSEDERLSITTDDTRWNIIKHQGALRLSLANTGRGLRMTAPSEGDSSPYSFGTSMVQGWVRLGDGTYVDVNNAGLAAGWTGWSGMWLNECGNGFIHEVGHTFTLLHFTEGTAGGWGIADEYPQDGTNLASHPWGYDTARQKFRTWYRVDAGGPVTQDGALVGKRDPMNGGEAASALSCYPQYTAYQMKRSQAWLQDSPTLRLTEGVPTVSRWDPALSHYVVEPPASNNQAPIAIDGPVVTLIGTLGNLDEVCQTYPPIFTPEGNAFALPDPADPDLHSAYLGGQWFLEITYADQSQERALIAKGAIAADDTSLALYAVNLDMTRDPQTVTLHRSPTAYPDVDVAGAELVHTRQISPSADAAMPVLRSGYGQLANHEMRLNHRCDPGVNCEARTAISSFPVADAALSFVPSEGQGDTLLCAEVDGVSTWSIPVISDDGETVTLTVHAQREVSAAPHQLRVPAHDATPWIAAPNLRQSLRVWLPYSANAGLAQGNYESAETFDIDVLRDGEVWKTLPIRVSLTVHEVETVDIPPTYTSAGVSIPEGDPSSSIYYLFEDPDIGPSTSKWWGDDTGNLVTVPVQDAETGVMTTLSLRAHKVACGSWWEINTGQSADWGCSHAVNLALEPGANDALISGHTYQSPGSHPVVIKGIRWHEPNAGQVLKTLALSIRHTAP